MGQEDKTAASIGTAVHRALALQIESGPIGKEDYEAIAEKMGIPLEADHIERLASYGMFAWNSLKEYLPSPLLESSVASNPMSVKERTFQLSGHIDVLSRVGTSAATFVDWKTGRNASSTYAHQMQGYALCLFELMGEPDDVKITSIAVFLAQGRYNVTTYTANDLLDWRDNLVNNVLTRPDVYVPGSHCAYCEHAWSCNARQRATSESVASFMLKGMQGEDGYDPFVDKCVTLLNDPTKTPEEIGVVIASLRERMAMVRTAIDETDSVIRLAVDRVGDIPLPDGSVLGYSSVARKTLKTGKALTILRTMMSEDDLNDCTTISLPKVKGKLVKNAVGREKRKKSRDVEESLRLIGALEIDETRRLEVKQKDVAAESGGSDGNEE